MNLNVYKKNENKNKINNNNIKMARVNNDTKNVSLLSFDNDRKINSNLDNTNNLFELNDDTYFKENRKNIIKKNNERINNEKITSKKKKKKGETVSDLILGGLF